MTLSTFLNVLGASIGFLSALFFAIGTLRLKAKDIAGIAGTYWDFNAHLADSIASQRADYIVGAVLLVSSFSLQVAANIVPATLQPGLIQSFGFAFCGIGLLVIVIGFLSRFLCQHLAACTKSEVRQQLPKELQQPTKNS